MGLETGTQIGALVPANPPGTDPIAQGDDHLRLIKTCVQGSLGAMIAYWTIPVVGEGLKQRNTGNSAGANLIKLVTGDDIEIGEGSIPVKMFNNLEINGTLTGVTSLTMAGPLVGVTTQSNSDHFEVTAGGARIHNDLQVTGGSFECAGSITSLSGNNVLAGHLEIQAGGADITGTLNMTGGANFDGAVNILNGNNFAIGSGGDMTMVGGGITATQTANGGEYSLNLFRSGLSSSFFLGMNNADAGATYRPFAGLFHEDDGAITLGGVQNDPTFQVLSNTIKLANMPTSAAGLESGALYRSGTTVLINL